MLKIIIDNNKCRLENIGLSLFKRITRELTFKIPGAEFSNKYRSGQWKGTYEFFKRNISLVGLLPIIINIINEYEVPYEIIDKRKSVMTLNKIDYNYKLTTKVLRDYQVDAANSILENYIGNCYFPRGIIHLATNGGKTVISEAIMNEILKCVDYDKIILFIVPTQEVAFQTEQNFKKEFPEITIGFIGAGIWRTGKIIIALVPTLYRNLKNKRFLEIAKKTCSIIIDEVQHASSNTYKKVLENFDNAFIRIGLTGTIPKDEIKKHMIYGLVGVPSIHIRNEFLIKQQASAKPLCYFIEIREPRIYAHDYMQVYSEGIVNNVVRNNAIVIITKLERLLNHNILILVDRVEHGEILKNMISKMNIGVLEFTNGSRKTKDRKIILDKLKQGKINILIATTVLDEGVDADNINAIIYARGQISPRKLLQGLGRGLRKKKDNSTLHFYDFFDFTHKDLTKHTLDRYNTLKTENFEIKELNITKLKELIDDAENNKKTNY